MDPIFGVQSRTGHRWRESARDSLPNLPQPPKVHRTTTTKQSTHLALLPRQSECFVLVSFFPIPKVLDFPPENQPNTPVRGVFPPTARRPTWPWPPRAPSSAVPRSARTSARPPASARWRYAPASPAQSFLKRAKLKGPGHPDGRTDPKKHEKGNMEGFMEEDSGVMYRSRKKTMCLICFDLFGRGLLPPSQTIR